MNVLQSRIIFSPNYLRWPFQETRFDSQDELGDYRDVLPSDLKDRVLRWNNFFLEKYSETEGEFSSQDDRARFDREYVALANKLWELGLAFDIDMWW